MCTSFFVYYKRDWAVNIDNIKVSMSQLGSSFKMDGWVEAWVINAFCRMLFIKKHAKFSLKHYFFNTVSVSITSLMPLIYYFSCCFCFVILFSSNLVETSIQHLYVLNRTFSLKNGRMKNLESIGTPKPLNHLVGQIKQKHYDSLKG
jgi:hypothetical protein